MNIHISNEIFPIVLYEVKQHITLCGILHYLQQEVVIQDFQEPPNCFVLCWVAFSEVWVDKVL